MIFTFLLLLSWNSLQRIELSHLKTVHEARQRFATQRKTLPSRAVFDDYRAILHVHAEDAAHTGGKREEVLRAAKQTGVSIIIFSDHDGPKPDTWRGLRDGVLFIPGAERGDQHLLEIDFRDGPVRFLSHVEECLECPTSALAGLEIYNRHTDTKDEPDFQRYFRAAMKNPDEWRKIGANLSAYPDEWFGAGVDYWPAIFAKWDRESQSRRLTGIAASDAHHNQVIQGLDFDPYERSFRNTSTHILARTLAENDIRDALLAGRAYVAHDWLADPTGFAFNASNNLGVFDMGDSVPFLGTTRLTAQLPLEARLKLLRNGAPVQEATASALSFTAKEKGVYRLEAWLSVDGEDRPWIYSNPIYLEDAPPLNLPSNAIDPNVDVVKDVAYAADEDPKHKLDLYLPKGKKNFPVLFFIHGGSWRSGDRSRYVALGNRFAKDGIGTVVISYRLAPQHLHPAQIDDTAKAFEWVVRNIEKYGGRRDRLFVAGHSAGGHLAALLALTRIRDIRGVIPMSGVYRIEGLDAVFGADPDVKKQASPLTYLRTDAPPFLITYCQWDYATLPAQAKAFHAALSAAGVQSQLLYVPRENHISEIVNIVKADDLTAQAVLKFVGSR